MIGIGGTGMRCLESFVHTCAIGMYDNTEEEMLALDTDSQNGNFGRLRDLVGTYNKINGGKTRENTFFSAKIKYYEFTPGYTGTDSFSSLSGYTELNNYREENRNGKEGEKNIRLPILWICSFRRICAR